MGITDPLWSFVESVVGAVDSTYEREAGQRTQIGDVVAALRGRAAVVRRGVEPVESSLVSQHGSLTPDEQLLPLFVVRDDSDEAYLPWNEGVPR